MQEDINMLDKAFNAIKTYDWGQDRKVLKPIDDAVVATEGNAAARKELELRLAAVLTADATYDAKQYVCRHLMRIGTAASVPTLAGLLADKKLSHMARYALERMPAPEAGKALRAALGKAKGTLKIGMISTLGTRGEAANVAPLKSLLGDSDQAVVNAAAYALGVIGSVEADKALAAAKPSNKTAAAMADASLACAEKLLAAGNKTAALAIYKRLSAGKSAKAIKEAAKRGMAACGGK